MSAVSACSRLIALGIALLAFGGVGHAQSSASFGRLAGLRVDVGPMVARGDGVRAAALREELTRALRQSFADRIAGGPGPTLVLRMRSLSLTPYVGGQGGRGVGLGGGGQSDYLDGEALLVGRRGEVLARHPQLSALPASSGGAWYDPDSERRRLTAIAEHYAQWLRRTLPGE